MLHLAYLYLNDPAPTELYPLSLHDALPISRCDAGEQAGGGAAAVAFEQELVFEAVDDRLDPLPDPADRRVGPVGLVMSARPQQQRAQLAHGRFEVGAGETFVADDRRTVDRGGLKQRERGFAFAA